MSLLFFNLVLILWPNSLEMRILSILGLLAIASIQQVKAQEIVPFPDLVEAYHQSHPEGNQIDDHNYTMYTADYQKLLKDMDKQIALVTEQINTEKEEQPLKKLIADKKALQEKRKAIIVEAELVEDLNKFY